MTKQALKTLQKNWQGPAIKVTLKEKTITLGQGKARTTIHINKRSLLPNLVRNPSLAFGEAYMKGDIEVEGELMDVLQGFHLTSERFPHRSSRYTNKRYTANRINRQSAIANAEHHYDIGNEFYQLWLDQRMTYSCAYFLHENDDLDTAQQQKLELICRKARLQKGQKIFDIGCGWGELTLLRGRRIWRSRQWYCRCPEPGSLHQSRG